MSEERKFYVHTKVREKVRDGNDGDVSNQSETGSIRTVSEKDKKNQAGMGIHRKFEIRERKETKIGRDIVEYDVITDDEDDARLDAGHYTEAIPGPSHGKHENLRSVSEGYVSGSEPSAMGVSSMRGGTPSVRRRVSGRYLREEGASGPGSRDVGVQMQTCYIIPKEKILSRVRDVGTQTRRSRHLLPQNPRILSDYSMERLRLLNSRENYVFDKEKGQLYRVISTSKRTIIDSESDSFTTVSEASEYDTLTENADLDTITETEVSDDDTIKSYDIDPTHKSHYVSDSGPKPGTRSVAVQMSTKLVVRREGLPPVKVRDISIQTKIQQPAIVYDEEGSQYSETIEKIWNNQVPFFPRRSLPPVETSIINHIDIDPRKRSSSPIIIPSPPIEGTPITSPRTPGRKTRLHRSASLPSHHRGPGETPRSHRESPRTDETPRSHRDKPRHRREKPHRSKSLRHRQENAPLTSSPRLIPFVDANEEDIKPVYKPPGSALGPLSDTDIEVIESEPPKNDEIVKREPNRANVEQKTVPVIDGSMVPTTEVNKEVKPNTPDLPDSPSPVQSVEITYTERKPDGDQLGPSDDTVRKHDGDRVDPNDNTVDKLQSVHHISLTEIVTEPTVLEPEVIRSETEDTYEFLEMLKTRRRRRRRKLKSPEQPPPGPSVLIRVGGGWMKEEHHRIQHKPLHKHMKPTADGLPFVKSAYIHSYSKQPVVIKHKKDTELRYASFIP
ncbi:hypothetical protein FSP39_021106 [Pinctada imbricata]|uniref:Uncharacterized protein n=1 Tax=Pinctada imbricata TaxID=66713 RepID=A0AA88YG33_PINIB|nr:hypothetical protein FSP39_021106 [Pinctada imbricata]